MTTGEKVVLIGGIALILSVTAWGGNVLLKKANSGGNNVSKNPDDNSPQFVFGSNPDKFSSEIINAAERIYRVESSNFSSSIYKNTFSAGMVATASAIPYGWDSLASLFSSGSNKPTGLFQSTNGKQYIKFPTLRAGVFALCVKLQDYENSHYKADFWNNGATGSATYLSALNAILPSACYSPSISGNPLL